MTIDDVIKKIERAAKARGIAPSTFCLRAVNSGKLHRQLMEGGQISLKTINDIDTYVRENPPKRRKRK